jgi:hypothetical protein
MTKKATGNKPVAFGPRTANKLVDLLNVREQQQRLGSGTKSKPSPIKHNLVKARNDVGSNLTRGSVVDVGDTILTGLSVFDPHHLWHEGNEQAGGHYGVFRTDVPDGEIAECQLTGVCIARVNVTDEDHTFAVPTAGETYFTSASSGEIQILDKITTGTGVKECVVVLRCGGGGGFTPQIMRSLSEVDGYRHNQGSVSGAGPRKYSSGTYRPLTLKINGSSVQDSPDDAYADSSRDVTAYNVATWTQPTGHPAWVWKDWKDQYLAMPIHTHKPRVVATISGVSPVSGDHHFVLSATGVTSTSYGSWGKLAETVSDDIVFRYSFPAKCTLSFSTSFPTPPSHIYAYQFTDISLSMATFSLSGVKLPPIMEPGPQGFGVDGTGGSGFIRANRAVYHFDKYFEEGETLSQISFSSASSSIAVSAELLIEPILEDIPAIGSAAYLI